MSKTVFWDPFEKFKKTTIAQFCKRRGFDEFIFDPLGEELYEYKYIAEQLGIWDYVKVVLEIPHLKRVLRSLRHEFDLTHKIYAISNVKDNSNTILGEHTFESRKQKEEDDEDEWGEW